MFSQTNLSPLDCAYYAINHFPLSRPVDQTRADEMSVDMQYSTGINGHWNVEHDGFAIHFILHDPESVNHGARVSCWNHSTDGFTWEA